MSLNIRLVTANERINDLEESIQNVPPQYKMRENKKGIKESHINLIGTSKDKNRENGEKTIFLEIMPEKFLELMKDIFLILDSRKGSK